MAKPELVDDEVPKNLEDIVELQDTPRFKGQFYNPDKIVRNKYVSPNAYKPTVEMKWKVRLLSISGCTQENIAKILAIPPSTLRKHYRDDLDNGVHELNSMVVGKLVEKIQSGDNSSIQFYLKNRAGWNSKTEIEVNHTHTMKPRSKEEIEEELKLLGVPEDKLTELAED